MVKHFGLQFSQSVCVELIVTQQERSVLTVGLSLVDWKLTDCSPRESSATTPVRVDRGLRLVSGGTNLVNYPIFGLDIRHSQQSTGLTQIFPSHSINLQQG